jgi:hypothetical protein
MKAYATFTGDDPQLQPLDSDRDDHYEDWIAKDAEAVSMIRHSCSPQVWCIVMDRRTPHQMENSLETRLDTVRSYIGRQNILHQFCACDARMTNYLRHTFQNLVTTGHSGTIQTMQSLIMTSACSHSHHCHYRTWWYWGSSCKQDTCSYPKKPSRTVWQNTL